MGDPGHPGHADEVAALTAEAEQAMAAGDWAAVVEAYEGLIERQPRNGDHRFMLARAYEETGRIDEAIAVFNDPVISSQEKARKRLARIYIDAKDYAAAIGLVDMLVAAHPEDQKFAKWQAVCMERGGGDRQTAEQLKRGQQLTEGNQLEAAEELYRKLLSEQPELPRAYLQLGQVFLLQKRWREAAEQLRSGLARDGNNRKIRNALARALMKLGEVEGTVELLQAGPGADKDADSQLLLQRCFVDLADWQGATDAAARLNGQLAPDDPLRAEVDQLQREAAVRQELERIAALSSSGDASHVLHQYRSVAERNPQSKVAWLALAGALSNAGHHQDSINVLREAATRLPNDGELRAALTKTLIETCDDETVLRHVEESAAADRNDFEGLRWLSRYRAARNDWAAAYAKAGEALVLQPASASARALLVQSLVHMERFDQALHEVEPLLASGEKASEALRLKGDILVRLGRIDEGIAVYCQALRRSRKDQDLVQRLLSAVALDRGGEPFAMRSLDDLSLGVSSADVEAAIAPFVGSEVSERGWRKREMKVWRGAIDRIAAGRGVHRDRAIIEREYASWATMSFDRYRTDRTTLTGSPWIWRGQKMLLDGAAAARFRTLFFGAVIRQLKPRRVLEVGSGNGINLLSLAGAFPDTDFVGLELTMEGIEQSQRAQSDKDLRKIVADYTMLNVADPAAMQRTSFIQGDASRMPFEKDSFDLVMTVLAVEQMETIRAAALSEIARVSSGHVLMLEPFRDANQEGLRALYVRSRGYFRGSISELADYGIEPVWATTDFPQEVYLGSALVLGKKRPL